MSQIAETDTTCGSASFKVESTHHLASRRLYVLAGAIQSGTIRQGMKIELDIHSGLIINLDVFGIEWMRFPDGEKVALTIKLESSEQLEFMEALELGGETLNLAPATIGAQISMEGSVP